MTTGRLLAAVAIAGLAWPAAAQEAAPDPFAAARIQFGAIAFNPTIAVTDIGVDTNVFNQWENPKQDFTATLRPGTEVLIRAANTRLRARANVFYQWFKTFSRESSWNTDLGARYDLDFVHVRPYAVVSYLNTRDRPGYEIDIRARRFEHLYTLGVDLPVSPRATFGVSGQRQHFAYAADAQFLGSYLDTMLNRNEDTFRASFRYKVTPLTTFAVDSDLLRTRFAYVPERDSNSWRVLPGLEFDAFALIQGSARVGVRKLNMLNPLVPDYTGPVAAVSLTHMLLRVTHVRVDVERDTYYSFDFAHPYYVQTGGTLTLTQRVRGPFDVQARGGWYVLDYVGDPVSNTTRTDRTSFYGGGVGYRVGKTTRLGFNVDSYRRHSELYWRDYEGLRIGSSLTYAF